MGLRSYDNREPHELVRLFCEGYDEAFTALVESAGGKLYGFIRKFVQNSPIAEDIYQTVWINVARNAASFDNRARFETWLFRIARNACIDELRRMKRRKTVHIGPAEEDGQGLVQTIDSGAPPPDEALSSRELAERIETAIEELPDGQRQVFLLKEDAGLTFEEIGDELGIGKETAKSRMRYAIKKLQSALGKEARLYGLSG